MSSFSYLLLMLRWHGNTNIWESLYIFPSGFGTGIAQSAVFISLQAVIQDPSHLAPAISFMYLSSTLAVTLGLPLGNAVMQTVLRRTLRARLLGLGFELGAIAEVRSRFLRCLSCLVGLLWFVANMSNLVAVLDVLLCLFVRIGYRVHRNPFANILLPW